MPHTGADLYNWLYLSDVNIVPSGLEAWLSQCLAQIQSLTDDMSRTQVVGNDDATTDAEQDTARGAVYPKSDAAQYCDVGFY